MTTPGDFADHTRTSELRVRVEDVLLAARNACSRPLHEEIFAFQRRSAAAAARSKDPCHHAKRTKPNQEQMGWGELLAEAALILHVMSPDEYASMLRYATIFLLGYIVPNSTGNDFFSLQYFSRQAYGPKQTNLNIFIAMDLEERLESTCKLFQANEYGELDVCPDPIRERSFRSFLQNGLFRFLGGRTAHPEETDLLHLVAMVISPQPNGAIIPETNSHLKNKSKGFARAEQLMKNIHSFNVTYHHRLLFVEGIANNLVLPEADARVPSPALFDAAFPHLRASLHAFATGARCAQDAFVAHRCLVNLVVQAGQGVGVKEEWNMLLKRIVNDRNPCRYPERGFCSHASRGRLLEHFVLTFNGSRHYADESFTSYVLSSLADTIKDEKLTLTKDSNGGIRPPCNECQMASLLRAARSVFYFILHDPEQPDKDEDSRNQLLESSSQLLHHPSLMIRKRAAALVSLSLSYGPKKSTSKLLGLVFTSLKMLLARLFSAQKKIEVGEVQCIESVIVAASRESNWFAASLFANLSETHVELMQNAKDYESTASECLSRLAAAIAIAKPQVANKKLKEIGKIVDKDPSPAMFHWYVALLSSRQAFCFDNRRSAKIKGIMDKANLSVRDGWNGYKFARYALATGNFGVATECFQRLVGMSSSERGYLWLTTLSTISEAEDNLLLEGAKGIPTAIASLYDAQSHVESLRSMAVGNMDFGFQSQFLRLRLDFLELCSATRLVSREIRLTCEIPKYHTRAGLHLKNLIKSWQGLSSRCCSLYRRFGLFLCQQSRSALRGIHAVCRFVHDAGAHLIGDSSHTGKEQDKDSLSLWPHGDANKPVIKLKQQLDKVIQRIDKSAEPNVRATAMIEILEGFLLTPFPYPQSFLKPKLIPSVSFRVDVEDNTSGPEVPDDLVDHDIPEDAEFGTVYPGTPYSIIASGHVPKELISAATVPFSQILLWYSVTFITASQTEEESTEDEAGTDEIGLGAINFGDVSFLLSPNGRFVVPIELQAIRNEGIYRLVVRLGCRDVRCGEWDLKHETGGTVILWVTKKF